MENNPYGYLFVFIYVSINGVCKLFQFIAGLVVGGFVAFIAFATFSMSESLEETIQREKREMDEI